MIIPPNVWKKICAVEEVSAAELMQGLHRNEQDDRNDREMISHHTTKMLPGPFVFASLGGFTCSICAPNAMTKAEIEAFAEREVEGAIGGWEAVDLAILIGRDGPATPNPCNQDPSRQHWFLLDGLRAAALGVETKK